MPTFPAVPTLPVDGVDLNFSGIGAVEANVTLSGATAFGTSGFFISDATGNSDAFYNDGGALGAKYTADTITVTEAGTAAPGEILTFGAYSIALNVQVGDASGNLVQPTAAIPITFHAQIQTLNGLVDSFYTVNSSVAGFEQITLPTAWNVGLVSLSWSVSNSLAFVESQDLVVAPNHRPVGADASFALNFNSGQTTFHLSATDADNQPLQYVVAPGTTLPTGVSLTPDGSVVVTPQASDLLLQPGQSRTISFQYEATDGAQFSGPGQVVTYTQPGTGGGSSGPPALGAGSGGSGFGLGDAYNYALIAFSPHNFQGTSDSPMNGNVGVGGTGVVQLASDKITGNLVTTGAAPAKTGGTVTGSIIGNSTQLAADIAGLTSLSHTLAAEAGTSVNLATNGSISASAGKTDGNGNEVFTVTKWGSAVTINGGANDHVVLNVQAGSGFSLANLTLTGGITANNVLINDLDTTEIHGVNGDTFNGTVIALNAKVNVDGVHLNGHLFGGAVGQDFEWVSNAVVTAPTAPGGGGSGPTTITETVALNAAPSTVSITINGPTIGSTLQGNTHAQVLAGGASAQWIIGGTAGDTLVGGSGGDTMIAGSAHSLIQGGSGSDLLIGAAGGDTLIAGSGAETLVGSGYTFAKGVTVPGLATLPVEPGISWNATATGATGVFPSTGDVFQFELSANNQGQTIFFGNSVVQGFDPTHDLLQISPFLIGSISDLLAANEIQQVGANTVISISHAPVDGTSTVSTITLVGVQAAALTAANLVAG